MPTDEAGKVDYKDFILRLNWRDCPCTAQVPASVTGGDENWQGTPSHNQIQNVNVQALAQDLSGGC